MIAKVVPLKPRPRARRSAADQAAAPFVKWAGGKRALIPDIAKWFPERVETYWEPFVGGGAVFFAMADRIERAVLSDLNDELVITYRAVRNRVNELIKALRLHERKNEDDDYYLYVRAQEPVTDIEIAARFIYLNKTCYNGLYRVNKSGKFNVPKGSYKNPKICDEKNLRAASRTLKKALIKAGDFENTVQPGEGDFIYCDPPYDDCFTKYQKDGFTSEDQSRLQNAINEWVDADADVMLSNAVTPMIKGLYRGREFTKHKAKAPRLINSRASGRGAVSEYIITSYV